MRDLMGKGSWWATVALWTALLMIGGMLVVQPSISPPGLAETKVTALPPQLLEIRVTTPQGEVLVQPEGSIQIDLAARTPVIRAVTCSSEAPVAQWRNLARSGPT
jgi:hypothetical protein